MGVSQIKKNPKLVVFIADGVTIFDVVSVFEKNKSHIVNLSVGLMNTRMVDSNWHKDKVAVALLCDKKQRAGIRGRGKGNCGVRNVECRMIFLECINRVNAKCRMRNTKRRIEIKPSGFHKWQNAKFGNEIKRLLKNTNLLIIDFNNFFNTDTTRKNLIRFILEFSQENDIPFLFLSPKPSTEMLKNGNELTAVISKGIPLGSQQTTRHETRDMGHETRDMGHETRDMGHETRDMRHETRDMRHETITKLPNYQITKSPTALLTSDSTHRRGIVLNADVTPTIFSYFNIDYKTESIAGYPMSTILWNSKISVLKYLKDMNKFYLLRHKSYVSVLLPYIFLCALSFLIGVYLIFYCKGNIALQIKNLFQFFLIYLLSFPLSFLFLSQVNFTNLGLYIMSPFILSLLISLLISAVFKSEQKLLIIFASTAFVYIFDLVCRKDMIINSLLGPNPFSGERFYGIGNENVGFMLPAGLIFISIMANNLRKKNLISSFWINGLILLWGIFVSMIIGYSKFGTNVGGFITSIFSSVLLFVLLKNKKISLQNILFVFGVTFLFLILIFYLDLNTSFSHIGRSGKLVSSDIEMFFSIFKRKIAMNLHSMLYTFWTWVLLVFLIIFPFIFNSNKIKIFTQIPYSYPYVYKCILTLMWGELLGFVVNDTGIAIAGTTAIFTFITWMFLAVEIQKNLKNLFLGI